MLNSFENDTEISAFAYKTNKSHNENPSDESSGAFSRLDSLGS